MIKWHDNETGHLVLAPKTCLHRNGALKRHFHCFFMILYFLLYYLCSLTCDVDGGIYVRNYWNVLFYVVILKINSLVINTCVPHFTAFLWFWCTIAQAVSGQLMAMKAQIVHMRLLVGKVAPKQVFLQILWFSHGSCLDTNAPTSLSARTVTTGSLIETQPR